MKRILSLAALSFVVVVPASSGVSAAGSTWPACTSAAQVECVESLSYTTASGTVNVANPAAPAGMQVATQPYVHVTGANPADPLSMLNFSVFSPSSTQLAPNVQTGLEDGTYTFVLRLGSFDPTQVFLRGDPTEVSPADVGDGTFTLTISAKPLPYVSPGPSLTTYESCKASGWTCDGESATLRSIAGGVFQNAIPANRPLFRGMWLASNGVSAGFKSTDLLMRKITANAAGPHTVPAGYPTSGLTMENGKALSPAFFKTFVPYTTLQAMLQLAPEEIRKTLTIDMVKAKITEAGAQKDQPITLQMGEKGVTIDLGLTHFSEPNPEITFSTPSAAGGSTSSSTAPASTPKKYPPGKKYAPSGLVTVPKGYRIAKTVINSASRKVCAVSGTRIQMKKAGSCSFTVTVSKGAMKKSIKGKVAVG